MNYQSALEDRIKGRLYAYPVAAILLRECVISGVCGPCSARAIGIAHPSALVLEDSEIRAII